MVKKKFKLAVIEDCPVQYRVPIYREMDKFKELEYHVYFFSLDNMSRRYLFESKNKNMIKIDMSGFKYSILKNSYPFENKIAPPRGLWNFGVFSEIINGDYDAVTIHGYSAVGKRLALLAAILKGTPILFKEEINEMAPGKVKQFFKKIFYRVLFKFPSIFLCSYTKNEEFYRSFGVPKEKCVLHPCAVDNKLYQKISKSIDSGKVRKKLKIPAKDTVFLCVGTIDKRKDSFNILRAFEKLKDKKSHLIYVGEGPEKEPMKGHLKRNKISNVTFIPFMGNPKDVSEFYKIADVFVMASISDPCPKVLNEAMNFSPAVIASDGVGTAFDMVKNGVNGFYYSRGSLTQLYNSMKKLSGDKKLQKKMGKETLKIVSKWNVTEDVKATLKGLNRIYENKKTISENKKS